MERTCANALVVRGWDRNWWSIAIVPASGIQLREPTLRVCFLFFFILSMLIPMTMSVLKGRWRSDYMFIGDIGKDMNRKNYEKRMKTEQGDT